ncbi:MAG: hypothetical protein AVDCRST_MAG66-3503 [uncultured Pseudonocardia sp.]|uniref:Efflux ABC transporter, permease protein n=1 Tax=uncultured Pseudonocardia sp. TaxID=211455 RepID=A0A6J4QAE8_9PSEU|nr:MAG: hypothetical protein AVDCRST_MAG66-3503 [uncultured Pseudonocardia sp.]
MSAVTVAGTTGPGLRGLVTAHLIALRTRGGLVLLALMALVPLAVMIGGLVRGQQTFGLSGADLARPLTDNIGNQLFALLLGTVLAGSAYRHGTIVPTLLAAPRRPRVVASALLAAGGVTAALTVVCALLGAAIALPWLAGQGVPLGEVVADPRLWSRALGQIAAVTAIAVLGAALAVLLRGVLGAVLVFVGVGVLESFVIGMLSPEWTRLRFFSALATVADPTEVDPTMPVWVAVVLLTGFLTAVITAALVATVRRDAA